MAFGRVLRPAERKRLLQAVPPPTESKKPTPLTEAGRRRLRAALIELARFRHVEPAPVVSTSVTENLAFLDTFRRAHRGGAA